MPRIRSVFPGLFTDEAFVSVSDSAQIFLVGIWTQCDDQGAFEWKPLSLRMRLRPTKDGPVEPLLAELEGANLIKSYEHDGRKYGIVRNFLKWQRPKSPSNVHFIPDNFRNYIGSRSFISEIDADKADLFPRNGEITPQREEGGGRKQVDEGRGKRKRKKEPSNEGLSASLTRERENGLFAEWNSMAAQAGLAQVQDFASDRRSALKRALAMIGGPEGWTIFLAKVRADPFRLGRNDRGWKATFDWVLKPKNVRTIMEENYDDRKTNGLRDSPRDRDFAKLAAVIDESERRRAANTAGGGEHGPEDILGLSELWERES